MVNGPLARRNIRLAPLPQLPGGAAAQRTATATADAIDARVQGRGTGLGADFVAGLKKMAPWTIGTGVILTAFVASQVGTAEAVGATVLIGTAVTALWTGALGAAEGFLGPRR